MQSLPMCTLHRLTPKGKSKFCDAIAGVNENGKCMFDIVLNLVPNLECDVLYGYSCVSNRVIIIIFLFRDRKAYAID